MKNLLVQSDLKLVIERIKGEYEVKEERMQKYLRLTRHLTHEFDKVEFVQVLRNQNMVADEISKLASSKEGGLNKNLIMEVQKHPSIEEVPTFTIQSMNSWMTPIISFLQDGISPKMQTKLGRSKRGRPDSRFLMTPYTKETSPCHT